MRKRVLHQNTQAECANNDWELDANGDMFYGFVKTFVRQDINGHTGHHIHGHRA